MKTIIRLKATEKYEAEASTRYYLSHQAHLTKRLAWLRETLLIRKALQLVGSPREVLDIPCGAGQYWSVLLAERADRQIAAADEDLRLPASRQMPMEIKDRVRLLRCPPTDIALPVQSVDAILCMRIFHFLGGASDRAALLSEFAHHGRYVLPASVVEAEFRAAGFRTIVGLDSPPFCGAARVYVLQK